MFRIYVYMNLYSLAEGCQKFSTQGWRHSLSSAMLFMANIYVEYSCAIRSIPTYILLAKKNETFRKIFMLIALHLRE